jgi:translation initiation factor IF-2
MLDDKRRQLKDAGPSMPVEILGLSGVPAAGDDFVVVENEARAREIAEFRQRRRARRPRGRRSRRAARSTADARRIQAGEQKEVPSSSRPTCRAPPRRSSRARASSAPTR